MSRRPISSFSGPIETRGARAIRIAIDEGGMRIEELEQTLERIESEGQLDRVKLIYTIPEHANPTGISLAAERRQPLVDLARKWSKTQRIFVLEDAAYRGLGFEGREPPTIWSLDRQGDTVILAGTFSKTLEPGVQDLATGFCPRRSSNRLSALKGNHDFGTANFNQQLVERMLADGSYERHVRRADRDLSRGSAGCS